MFQKNREVHKQTMMNWDDKGMVQGGKNGRKEKKDLNGCIVEK